MISLVLRDNFESEGRIDFINENNYQSFLAQKFQPPQEELDEIRIGIISDFTLQPIIQCVNVAARVLNYKVKIIEFPIESINQLLLNSSSNLYSQELDVLIIYPDYAKYVLSGDEDEDTRDDHTTKQISRLIKSIEKYYSIKQNKVILVSAPTSQEASFQEIYTNMNILLRAGSSNFLSILRIDFRETDNTSWFDFRLLKHFRIPFAPSNLTRFIGSLVHSLRHSLGCPIKMVITDLDGTLWEPILAEERTPDFRNYLESLQKSDSILAHLLREQADKGLLLSIATKNQLDKVQEVLENLSSFPLNVDSFYRIEANWGRKSDSIKRILESVGFQPRNVLFIDDSPLECIEVKKSIPDIQVVHVENQSKLERKHFHQSGLFAEEQIITKEDSLRIESYRITNSIKELDDETQLKIFIEDLNQVPTLEIVQIEDHARINQMHERTNQFRANSKPFTPVLSLSIRQAVLKLKDRYMDYGTVGYLEWDTEEDAVSIRQFLLSCRVFNRGLDSFMIREILNLESLNEETPICVSVEETGKNQVFLDFLATLEFKREGSIYSGSLTKKGNTN